MATSASPAPLRSSSATELEMTSNHLGIGGLRDGNAVILHINGRNSFSSVESSQEEYQSGWCAACLCSMYNIYYIHSISVCYTCKYNIVCL